MVLISKRLLLLFTACTAALAADSPLRVAEGEAKRAAVEKPAPEYPLVARQLKVAGMVTLEATISPEGEVSSIRIVSGSPILTKPAADALRKWKFKPFRKDGEAVQAVTTLNFEFDTH